VLPGQRAKKRRLGWDVHHSQWEIVMAHCDCCGNDYEHTFVVEKNGQRYTFDSIECAAQMIAPNCARCGTRILGHGTDANGKTYCCNHCARQAC
jgi:hypothetical protein